MLQKVRIFDKAVECFNYVITESLKDIRAVGVDVYAYKCYQAKAVIHFDILCFKTAFECLGKAEGIIQELYERKTGNPSRQMLEHRKIVSRYYRKFQKFDKALEILMDVYKTERKIYTNVTNEEDQVEDEHKEEEKQDAEEAGEDDQKVEILEEVKIEEEVVEKPIEDSDVDGDELDKDINLRLGQTMIQIMEIHALKNDLKKGLTFRNAAEKYILAATKGDKKNKHYIKFLQASGHMFFKSQDSKDISKAYDFYDEANKLLEEVVGNKSIDYLLSFVDIGEVYLYQRDYEKADAFLTFCRDETIKYYGERSIYLNRVNSALIEVHAETKESRGDITFKYSMDNLDIAIELYGEMSIFTLGFYMSGVSANSTRGNYNVVNNILNKMGQILEMSGEGYNGNQYFFLSSIIAGMIASQSKDFEKAVMLFSSTLRRQLEYVGLEKDHPFLEQTYYHLAMLYNRAGNLNRSLVMWNSALEVGKRKYGENSYLLATNYKNIGVCEIGLGLINEAIKNLDKAKNLCKSKLDTTDNKIEIKAEQRELGEIYYNLYLAYVSKSDWDGAISANEQSYEALHYATKANEIIDRKPEREPLLFVRYRFLRAKLYKNLEKNEESLKDLDEAIQVSESYKRLYAEEIDLKKFRTDLISTLSEEERASFGIDMKKEQEKERRDKEKRDFLESEYKNHWISGLRF